jgi:hypothetical protein
MKDEEEKGAERTKNASAEGTCISRKQILTVAVGDYGSC